MAATRDWILVGTSGSPGSTAAVHYAAHAAARRGAALRIVHVAPSYRPLISLYPSAASITPAEVEALGSAVLRQAIYEAQWYLEEDDVDGLLLTGDRIEGLLRASDGHATLVLGRSQGGAVRRIATGALLAAVAGRATVPVVVVPEGWAPSEPTGRLLAGIKRLDAIPEAQLRGAFRLAAERGSSVEVVHVGSSPLTAVASATPLAAGRAASDDAASEVQRRIAALVSEFPGLHVVVQLLAGDPATLLTRQTEGADALVIARPASPSPTGHLGSVGAALLRAARCPVIVLPVAEAPGGRVADLATAGAGRPAPTGEEAPR